MGIKAIAVCAFVGMVLGLAVELRAQPAASVVGQWVVRDQLIEVRADFRVDGTFSRVTRSADGVENVVGTYRVVGGAIEITPQGSNESIKLTFRMPDGNTLELTGDDGAGVRMVRQDAPPAVPQRQNPLAGPGAGNAKPVNPLARPPAKKPGVTYTRHRYIDEGGLRDPQTGQWLEGFSILVPRGWKFTGGFRWVAREKPANLMTKTDMLNPVKSDYAIASPDGRYMFRQYPVEYWCAIDMFPPGHNYNGMIVCQALTPEQYITQFVIPRQRGLGDARIVAQQPLEQLAARYEVESKQLAEAIGGAAPGTALSFRAGTVSIEYTESGVAMREQFVCIQQYLQTANMVMWWPRMNFSIRAPRDEFAAMTPVFTTIAVSVQTNPYWSIELIRMRDKVQVSIAQAEAYANKVRREIAASHAQTNHELARDSGYLSGDYYDYKGTDGNRYNLPTDKYHFMNKDGDLLSQDDSVPPSSEWTSIEPYNQ